MSRVIAPVAALLFSVAFLIMVNGLQDTLLAVRGRMGSFTDVSNGLPDSTCFGGFVMGCLVGARLINRVGADLYMMIWQTLKANDIKIPYPRRDVSILERRQKE